MKNNSHYVSYLDSVIVDIKKAEKKVLNKAAKHIEKSIKDKIGQVGIKKHTGNLKKGVGSKQVNDDTVLVGFGPPAQHAHLLEFGTKERHKKTGKPTGRIRATPILAPVIEEQADAVREILSDRWL